MALSEKLPCEANEIISEIDAPSSGLRCTRHFYREQKGDQHGGQQFMMGSGSQRLLSPTFTMFQLCSETTVLNPIRNSAVDCHT